MKKEFFCFPPRLGGLCLMNLWANCSEPHSKSLPNSFMHSDTDFVTEPKKSALIDYHRPSSTFLTQLGKGLQSHVISSRNNHSAKAGFQRGEGLNQRPHTYEQVNWPLRVRI